MNSINPAAEQLIREYPEMTSAEVGRRLELALGEFRNWRQTPLSDRAQCMLRLATLLRERCGELARLMTDEMGKPIRAAESEIDKCASVCDYYAENAERFIAPRDVA